MTGTERVNGHRPKGLLDLLDPSLKMASHPQQQDTLFDLEQCLGSVVNLSAQVPEDAFSARTLGTEREGNAIVISDDGVLVTIGYLVVDSSSIYINAKSKELVQAELIGYNHETGLALIQALKPVGTGKIVLGTASDLKEDEPVIVAPYGGSGHAINATISSLREFTGSWEYLLEMAIFSEPPHPNWSGAALIRQDGSLCGVGSLWVNDAKHNQHDSPGNMFVPIDLLKPIYDDLVSKGAANPPHRPWLGMYTSEAMDNLFISGLTPEGPAELAGIEVGDIITGIDGHSLQSLSQMYRKLWSLGEAGITVVINLMRDGDDIDISVITSSRYSFVTQRSSH